MLANGFLTTSDQFAALFFLAAVAANWALFHRVTVIRLGAASVTSAGLLLCKSSGVLLGPMIVLLIATRVLHPEPLPMAIGRQRDVVRRVAVAAVLLATAVTEAVLVLLIIWGSFGFRYSGFVSGEPNAEFEIPWARVESGLSPATREIVQTTRTTELLPEAYIYGLTQLLQTKDRRAFLHGQLSWSGWTAFFPVGFAIKSPLEVMALLVAALWTCCACPSTVALSCRFPVATHAFVSAKSAARAGDRLRGFRDVKRFEHRFSAHTTHHSAAVHSDRSRRLVFRQFAGATDTFLQFDRGANYYHRPAGRQRGRGRLDLARLPCLFQCRRGRAAARL